ncbi:Crp/Fnr family transcriptional regulator [Geochorda subterranea]|uniref:Crp/Fnr family transcriptional regulator n=1 Tax=Geochorda subterranea TaxID=3109564 RepID=A0ABZ1BSW6_9FIRM|nr:Crp/Fnr family transcriptional regulator [Limnochorda sp. LNt]WRP15713.1 Crp/Fnr family transcriptional regulator [Limnochorda sp. LNt]
MQERSPPLRVAPCAPSRPGVMTITDRPETALAVLRRTSLFDGLDEGQLAAIAQLLHRRHYRRGMFVFLEGEPVEAVYFIETGSVKASTTDAEGREHILNVLGPGSFFPHVGFLDGGPAPATVQSLEETTVWVMERAAFYALLASEPAIAVRMVAVLGRHIRRLHAQLREMGMQPVPARLVRVLLRLARQLGEPVPERGRPGAVRIRVHLSHQDLAGMAGTTRESVSRLLAAFRGAGLVRLERGLIVLDDPSKLEEWG